jgi:hypothetical protein
LKCRTEEVATNASKTINSNTYHLFACLRK